MSEKVYRLNGRGLLLYVREDIPTQWRDLLLYGVCFCMSEKIYRLNGEEFAFVCQRGYTDSMKGGCCCKGSLLLYVREDIQ